jgi:trk system potassium uptake protein TrkA
MKTIICGAGQVGRSIAQQLVSENNHVTIIDQSAELIDEINSQLDVKAIVGFASHPTVLRDAGADDADMIIAVTQSDEINMISCQVAHSVFGVKKKIARIRNQNYLQEDFKSLYCPDHLPIDVIISPEVEVANAIMERLHVPGAIETLVFADGSVKIISAHCVEGSVIKGLSVEHANEALLGLNSKIIGVKREGGFIIPTGRETLGVDDEIYFVASVQNTKEIMSLFGHEEKESRKIRIIGGGRVGLFLAEQMEENGNFQVKILEYKKERAEYIASKLYNTMVINGDALDQEILKEANISTTDTIIAVSNDDEVNILSSLLAKKLGCKQSISLINSVSYAPLFSSLGIDVIVSPRATTVSSILQHIRHGKVKNVSSLYDGKVEIIEAEAVESSFAAGKSASDLNEAGSVILAAVVRDSELIIPTNDFIIKASDRLIIITQSSKVKKVEKILSDKIKYF